MSENRNPMLHYQYKPKGR